MEDARYFKIGLFAISAIVLAVIGVAVLGGGAFFQKTNIIETYIDESVQGLDVGSPMRFRGVLVGKVEEITLTSVEYNTRRRYVLVRAGISSNMFQFPLSDPASPSFLTEIEKGLRVRLAPQGLTGTAYLEADYLDPSQNPPLEIDWQPKYPYVPSARSKITQHRGDQSRTSHWHYAKFLEHHRQTRAASKRRKNQRSSEPTAIRCA
jgi:phospholipid/cholesterol/gamma-HCH transport system substrate-binding protein